MRYIKMVGPDWCGVHQYARKSVVYKVGEVTTAPDFRDSTMCGNGLHFADLQKRCGSVLYSAKGHLIEVRPVGRVVHIDDTKSKAQSLKVIREITEVPPKGRCREEVRAYIASRLPMRFLRVKTAKEEPSAKIRKAMLQTIPACKLPMKLSRKQEPCRENRIAVVRRKFECPYLASSYDKFKKFIRDRYDL